MLLVAWKQPISWELDYDVSKVNLERIMVEVVVSVVVERLFGIGIEMYLWRMEAVSLGEHFVLVWKPSGDVRIYDLRTREWDDSVPYNPVAAMEGFSDFQMWYGKAMHLKLPSTTRSIFLPGDA